jgi:hypothetical protein
MEGGPAHIKGLPKGGVPTCGKHHFFAKRGYKKSYNSHSRRYENPYLHGVIKWGFNNRNTIAKRV